MTMNSGEDGMVRLPDGSGFCVGSFPLPADHWIYGESEDGPPALATVRDDGVNVAEMRRAIRNAIRGSTRNGKDMDFDPDALVTNVVIELTGMP